VFRVARNLLRVFALKAKEGADHDSVLALRAEDIFGPILSIDDKYCGRLSWF
jgi:hypothetical protein